MCITVHLVLVELRLAKPGTFSLGGVVDEHFSPGIKTYQSYLTLEIVSERRWVFNYIL